MLGFQTIAAGDVGVLIAGTGDDACLVDTKRPCGKVDITPLEGQGFTHPQTGIENQQIGRGVVIKRLAELISFSQFSFQNFHFVRRKG